MEKILEELDKKRYDNLYHIMSKDGAEILHKILEEHAKGLITTGEMTRAILDMTED